MKRGQEFTDYINASFIDVRMKNFMDLSCYSDILLFLIRLYEMQSMWFMKNISCFIWVWLRRVSK